MTETRININDLFKKNREDNGSCSEAEPFALQVIDDSMEPEFNTGCIIIIDSSAIVRDGSYVFAKDLNDAYIFRRLRIMNHQYFLEPP